MKARLFIIIGTVLALAACGGGDEHCSKDAAASGSSCCSKDAKTQTTTAETTKPSGESLFGIETEWTTQSGGKMRLADLAGKVTVTAMIFTHCESACPRIVADIQRIESALSAEERARTQFVLITMDPLRDTPARLTEFAQEHRLGNQWTLLTADEDASLTLANVLNVRVKKLSGGGFDHSNIIFVLDQQGAIAHQQEGLAVEPTESIQTIQQLLKVQ